MKHLSLRVPESELSLWKAEAHQQGLTLTALIRLRMSGEHGGLSEQIRVTAEHEGARVVRRQVAEEAHDVVRGELDEIVSAKVLEAVGASSLDPAQVEFRLGQVEQAVRSLNQTVRSGQFRVDQHSTGGDESEPFIESA